MDIFFSTSMVLRSEAFTRKGAPLLINQNQKSNGHKHKRSIIIFSKLYPFQRHLTRDHYIIFFTSLVHKTNQHQRKRKKKKIHNLHVRVQLLHFINLKISHNTAVTILLNYDIAQPTTQRQHKTKSYFNNTYFAV